MASKIIVIRGPLGVGKTTISTKLAEKINAQYISIDQIIDENNLSTEDGIPLQNFLSANIICKQKINQSEMYVVVDGCFYHNELIQDLKSEYKEKIIFITLNSSIEKCISRDAGRTKVYGPESARFVHGMVGKVITKYEINSDEISTKDTLIKVLEIVAPFINGNTYQNLHEWNLTKSIIDVQQRRFYVKPREVVWVHLGQNVGDEENGKGNNFQRPVLVLKVFNKNIFFGIPLSTKIKLQNKYYELVRVISKKQEGEEYVFEENERSAMLSHARLFDTKRVIQHIGYVKSEDFVKTKNALTAIF